MYFVSNKGAVREICDGIARRTSFLTREQFGRICDEITRRTSFLTREQFERFVMKLLGVLRF